MTTVQEQPVPEFDSAKLRSYSDDPDYQYQRRAPDESWIGRLWKNILDYLKRLFSEGSGFGEKLIAFVLIGGAIVILVYFFLRSRFHAVFSRSNRRNGNRMRILNEDIPVTQLSQKIQEALSSGDYRTAFRWTYINLLHRLGQSGVIRLHNNKTNTDYKREINAVSIQQDFGALADAFDFTWYGEYPIDRPAFDQYNALVVNVLKQTSGS